MTSDIKAKPRANVTDVADVADVANVAASVHVNREAVLSIASGLTETERDLVAEILDMQLEGMLEDFKPREGG